LYEGDLKDLYWAENHIIKALPKMAKAAASAELETAFTKHLAQAHTHVSRLKKVFAVSGLEVGSKKCEAMDGLTKEGAEVIEDHAKGRVRDAGLIIAAPMVEHYEISAYGSLRALAEVMGFEEAAETLQETLDEEAKTDKLLSGLAETIKQEAFTEAVKEEN
jgi:ferritin-like metal-binding protein YciE